MEMAGMVRWRTFPEKTPPRDELLQAWLINISQLFDTGNQNWCVCQILNAQGNINNTFRCETGNSGTPYMFNHQQSTSESSQNRLFLFLKQKGPLRIIVHHEDWTIELRIH